MNSSIMPSTVILSSPATVRVLEDIPGLDLYSLSSVWHQSYGVLATTAALAATDCACLLDAHQRAGERVVQAADLPFRFAAVADDLPSLIPRLAGLARLAQ